MAAKKKVEKESMEDMNCACGMGCSCVHHYAMPTLVTVFGLAFLLNRLGYLVTDSVLSLTWPILVVLAGLYMFAESKCACCC